MTDSYWLERWQQGRIGFHLTAPNANLVAHYSILQGSSRILVPLCGKSVDLAWLHDQGHEVVGVDLSELAAQAFFEERGWTATRHQRGPFLVYTSGRMTFLVGDFFQLSTEFLGSCDGAYDRAALIALPEPLRATYANKLISLLPSAARMLLVTLDFDVPGGPPYAVSSEEVESLYGRERTEILSIREAGVEAPSAIDRGASYVREVAYSIQL
ncbi:MAG TPA: hypothetical protein VFQ61_29015 [Polyangiaceae bacterium]|nr:hypothetical protein [Polyangiaceae bacterium]